MPIWQSSTCMTRRSWTNRWQTWSLMVKSGTWYQKRSDGERILLKKWVFLGLTTSLKFSGSSIRPKRLFQTLMLSKIRSRRCLGPKEGQRNRSSKEQTPNPLSLPCTRKVREQAFLMVRHLARVARMEKIIQMIMMMKMILSLHQPLRETQLCKHLALYSRVFKKKLPPQPSKNFMHSKFSKDSTPETMNNNWGLTALSTRSQSNQIFRKTQNLSEDIKT